MSGVEERLADDPTSELWGEHRARYRFATRYLNGAVVLDVACGSGFGLQMIEQTGSRPLGIDYDLATLRAIRCARPSSRLIRGDATRLPLRSNSFDVVLSFETIEHVADATAMVAELRRVLKPGGRLVVSTPNAAFGPAERHTLNPFHVREFTPGEFRDLLQEHFADVRLYGQRPSRAYRFVPFLMVEWDYSAAALAWKALVRLPFGLRNRVSMAVSGRAFYPGEADYRFETDATDEAHALVAVAQ